MQHRERAGSERSRGRERVRWMPVRADDDSGQKHRGSPEKHHNRIAETHVEFFVHGFLLQELVRRSPIQTAACLGLRFWVESAKED